MKRNIYIALGIIFILSVGIVMVYRHMHKASDLSAEVQELNIEAEDLSQDINSLEGIVDDSSLNSLDDDLSNIAEEDSGEISPSNSGESLESMGDELEADLEDMSKDLVDLEDFENEYLNDVDFDTALSGM